MRNLAQKNERKSKAQEVPLKVRGTEREGRRGGSRGVLCTKGGGSHVLTAELRSRGSGKPVPAKWQIGITQHQTDVEYPPSRCSGALSLTHLATATLPNSYVLWHTSHSTCCVGTCATGNRNTRGGPFPTH